MNVIETFMVDDVVSVTDPDNKEQRRDAMRAEILRYNSKSTGSYDSGNDRYTTSGPYLEPTSDGVFPGLEDGLLGG